MDPKPPEQSDDKKVEKIKIKSDPDGSKTNEAKQKSRIERKRDRWKKNIGTERSQFHTAQSSSVKPEPDADNQSVIDTSKLQESDDDDIFEVPTDPYSCRRTAVYVRHSKTYANELTTANSASIKEEKPEIKQEDSPNALKRKPPVALEHIKIKKIKTEDPGTVTKPVKTEGEPGVNPAEPVILPSRVNLKPADLKKCSVCVDRLEDSTDPLVIRWKQCAKNSPTSNRDDSFSSNNSTPKKQSPTLQQKVEPKDEEKSPKLVRLCLLINCL